MTDDEGPTPEDAAQQRNELDARMARASRAAAMDARGSRKRPVQMYRRLLHGPALPVMTPAGPAVAEAGDFISAPTVRSVSGPDRRRLAMALGAAAVERATGIRPDEDQHVIRPVPLSAPAGLGGAAPGVGVLVLGGDDESARATAALAVATSHCPVVTAHGPDALARLRAARVRWIATVPAGLPLRTGWLADLFDDLDDDGALAFPHIGHVEGQDTAPMLYRDGGIVALDALAPAMHPAGLGVFYADDGVVLSPGWMDACLRAIEATGAPAAVPVHNIGDPLGQPSAGDQSPWPRLPGGRGPLDVALALLADAAPPVRGCPKNPAAIVLSRELADAVARGERPDVSGAVVAMDAFCWRAEDKPGRVAELVDTRGGRADGWALPAARARRAVAASRPRGLPVAFYSHNVGPWGGVAVLLRLADELQALGASAFVLHHSTTPHRYRPTTSPLRVRRSAELVHDFPGHVGWREGLIVASHWGSGQAVADIVQRNPGVVATSILQDREDLFEDRDGDPVGASKCGAYLALGRGVSVSRWILDSAAADLGLRLDDYRVIPNGVDLDVFRPPGRPPGTRGPVRILAMWRPQTEVRRGIRLLREVYEDLHRRFGTRVSLELFGWNDREGTGKAPPFCRHHGVLAPEGVAALMAEVDIVVEPSLFQGWGLVGSEAMACGAAFASTACRGVEEYAVHEQNALVVPHADLGDAVAALVEDDVLRRRLAEAGVETMRSFGWDRIGARWALYLCDLWEEEHGAAGPHDVARLRDRALELLGGTT